MSTAKLGNFLRNGREFLAQTLLRKRVHIDRGNDAIPKRGSDLKRVRGENVLADERRSRDWKSVWFL